MVNFDPRTPVALAPGSYVMGIDAGGTKTVCLLADEQGRIVSEGRGAGANLHAAGELEVEKVLHAGDGSRRSAIVDIMPAAICLGIAGVDREDEARTVRAIMRRIGYKSRMLVVNDALIALVAGAGDAPGIVIIAGTGSIVYGRNARGEAARAGGWGHMIGDEGSGYWIGREALAAVMRAGDGRGPATQLTADMLAHFEVDRCLAAAADRLRPRAAAHEPWRRSARSCRGVCEQGRRRRDANSRAGGRRDSCWRRGRWRRDWKCAATSSRFTSPAECFASCRGSRRELPRRLDRGRAAGAGRAAGRGAGGRGRVARARGGPRRRARAPLQD